MTEPKLKIRTDIYSADQATSVLRSERKVASVQIGTEEFNDYFLSFKESAFRFETLPAYAVAHEDAHYAAYREGKTEPPFRYTNWENIIDSATKAGKQFEIVRVVPEPLTEYFCYEVDWHYLRYADLGQQTRFVYKSALPPELKSLLGADFWLFDNKFAVTIEYNQAGDVISFLKVTDPQEISLLKKAKEIALQSSYSLEQFLKTYKSVRESA
jgi:hypothetical protein